ncbi:tetratricopeptide repeat protein [Amycolatopsis sp. H6(2020)]|nr:tetratricopeptide repeat protein [Amycolatopsis sp. H6(2020)]
MSGATEFRLLGAVEADRDGVPVDLGRRRERCLLGLLLLEAGRLVQVERLLDLLWDDDAPPTARASLHTHVSRLRAKLDPDGTGGHGVRLLAKDNGYLAEVDPLRVDVHRFRTMVGSARQLAQPAERAGSLRRALALWRGPALADVASDRLRDRVTPDLTELRMTATDLAVDAELACGREHDLVAGLYASIAEFPVRERPVGQLMLALYRTGRRVDALAAYHELRGRLADRLGVDPGPELQDRFTAILRDDPALALTEPEPVTRQAKTSAEVGAWRQLPMDIAEFTGRQPELRCLHALVGSGRPDAPTAVVISTIAGMAGVGKTRLAVHAAHQLVSVGRFDEIQLWTDLHGFDARYPPADPGAVLGSFLRLLGVPGQQIPHDLDGRAALYRDRLADKRALVLLDNAATEDQIRPLLPGTTGCLVLITSRHSLPLLDGTHPLHLDVLTPAEAIELLGRITGDDRVDVEPEAAAMVAALCGHLPIAISLAARRLRSRPVWTVADLADRLSEADRRLEQLSPDARGLHGVFDLSYQALPPDQRRVFRLLGLHPGDDFTAESAAALSGVTPPEAEFILERLLDEHLLQQATAGRYRFHDLIRIHARDRAHTDETAAQREGAVHRLLTWYLHAAESARRVLDPLRVTIFAFHRLPPGCVVPGFDGYDVALTWFETERATLRAVVRTAAESGLNQVAWQLPWVLLSFYYRRSHWDDWIAAYRIALDAVRALGDRRGEGIIRRGLGVAHSDLRQYTAAIDCHVRAQALLEEAGDRQGQAWNLNNLGVVYVDLERLADAVTQFELALPLFRETGDAQGEGYALNNLGDTYRRLGRPEPAVEYLEQALIVQARTGDEAGLQFTLSTLGDVHRDAGHHDLALARYRQALATSKELRDPRATARALASIAIALDDTAAFAYWRQALEIFDQLGDAQAAEIRARLDGKGGGTG